MKSGIVDCADCVFWVRHNKPEMGTCRRHAPIMIEAILRDDEADPSEKRWGLWPQTYIEDGCGDGAAK